MTRPAAVRPAGDRPGTFAVGARRASLAVFAVFIAIGVTRGTLAARLPAIRDGLRLAPGQVGLLLLVGSLGALFALPATGLVVHRLGTRGTVTAAAVLSAIGLTLASLGVEAGRVPVAAAGLVAYGVGSALWDAAMNLEGAFVEQRLGRTIMPRYHAGYSLGTAVAAGLAALAAAGGVRVGVHVPVLAAVSSLAAMVAAASFLPVGHAPLAVEPAPSPQVPPGVALQASRRRRGAGAGLAWVERRTLLIGVVLLAFGLSEVSAQNWLSLAVTDDFSAGEAIGAAALAVFVTVETLMRWFGTRLVDRYGRVVALRISGALVVVGIGCFGLVGPLWLALVGVAAWGAGVALPFPIGMSAASDDPVRAAARVSVVATISYASMLAGPPLLGALADSVGYRHALLAVLGPVTLGLLAVGAVRPPRRPTLDG